MFVLTFCTVNAFVCEVHSDSQDLSSSNVNRFTVASWEFAARRPAFTAGVRVNSGGCLKLHRMESKSTVSSLRRRHVTVAHGITWQTNSAEIVHCIKELIYFNAQIILLVVSPSIREAPDYATV